MSGSSRGIAYVAWGEKWLREACESSASARKLGYRTCVITDDLRDWSAHFDLRRVVDFTSFAGMHPLMRKWICLTETPFESTAFVDTDTRVHEPIDLGFELAEQFGLALTIAPGMILHYEHQEHVHYNTGVAFFRGYQPDLLRLFVEVAREIAANAVHDGDEAPVSVALRRAGINPAVLPAVFNCVRAGQIHTRRIKVWHSRQWARHAARLRPVRQRLHAVRLPVGGARMPSVTLYPGTVATNVSALPGADWTNPNNVKVADGSSATVDLPNTYHSYYLQCSNFNFASHIPSSGTPVGIQATLKKSGVADGSSAMNITDYYVQLYDGSSLVGSNKADALTVWPGSLTNVLYGGSADTWSWGSISRSLICSSGFGIWVAAQNLSASGAGYGVD